MTTVIIDTNVPIVANGDSAASPDCQDRCIDALLDVTSNGRIAVDASGLIVEEYGHQLMAGQPGVGHEFLRWVFNNQWDESRCDQVVITQVPGSSDPNAFVEFPDAPALSAFDPSDRKFVAVAAAHPDHPPILEAADAKWIGWAPALEGAAVTVEFVCEHELRALYDANYKAAKPRAPKRRTGRG